MADYGTPYGRTRQKYTPEERESRRLQADWQHIDFLNRQLDQKAKTIKSLFERLQKHTLLVFEIDVAPKLV